MKSYRQLQAVLSFFFFALIFSSTASATTYRVTNAAGNCGAGDHGLWTNTDLPQINCGNYLSIDGTLDINTESADEGDWFAYLNATAINPAGTTAGIHITFGEWQHDHQYKQEGGAIYGVNNVDFFTSILGTITIGEDTYDIDGFAEGYAFQYGMGANAKNPDVFGASAWIQSCISGTDGECMDSHHWDLNLSLTPVPIPGSLILFGSALFAFGSIKRSAKARR